MLPKCHAVGRYKRKCNIINDHKKCGDFHKLTNPDKALCIQINKRGKYRYKFIYGRKCSRGTQWRSCLRHCATSRKVAGSIPGGIIGIFHWHNSSGRTMALELTQPLTEMSTRNISWGYRRPLRRADSLTTFMCRLSWNLGASASWYPQGLSRPVTGLLYLFTNCCEHLPCGISSKSDKKKKTRKTRAKFHLLPSVKYEFHSTAFHWSCNFLLEVSVDLLHPAAPKSVDKYGKHGYKTHLSLYVKHDCEGKANPLEAWTGPECSRRLRLPDFKTVGTWRWYGCQPCAPAAFTPRKYSWFSFLLESESTPRSYVRPKGLCQGKIPMIPPGIEPATFRFIAQCLNQLRHRVPPKRDCQWDKLHETHAYTRTFVWNSCTKFHKIQTNPLVADTHSHTVVVPQTDDRSAFLLPKHRTRLTMDSPDIVYSPCHSPLRLFHTHTKHPADVPSVHQPTSPAFNCGFTSESAVRSTRNKEVFISFG